MGLVGTAVECIEDDGVHAGPHNGKRPIDVATSAGEEQKFARDRLVVCAFREGTDFGCRPFGSFSTLRVAKTEFVTAGGEQASDRDGAGVGADDSYFHAVISTPGSAGLCAVTLSGGEAEVEGRSLRRLSPRPEPTVSPAAHVRRRVTRCAVRCSLSSRVPHMPDDTAGSFYPLNTSSPCHSRYSAFGRKVRSRGRHITCPSYA